MCTNGVNSTQLKTNIEQIDEAIVLSRRWVHRAYHSADGAQFAKTANLLHQAQGLLDDARALLSEAVDVVDEETSDASGVSVNLV